MALMPRYLFRAELNHWFALFLLLVLVAGPFGAAPLKAAPLPVAGDGGHLWVVQPARPGEDGQDDSKFVVRHRGPRDAPDVLRYASTLTQAVTPLHIAASDETLWLVEADGSVTTLTGSRSPGPNSWQYEVHHQASLPDDTILRAFDAGEAGGFALLRVEAAEVLRELDEEVSSTTPATAPAQDEYAALRRMALNLPPNIAFEPFDTTQADATRPATTPDGATETEDEQAEQQDAAATDEAEPGVESSSDTSVIGVDRLVQLRGTAWHRINLPEDWPGGEAQLVAPETPGAPLWLISHDPNDAHTLHVYEYRDDAWQREDYTLTHSAPVAAISVDGQLVIAQPMDTGSEHVAVHFSVMRGGQELPLGESAVEVAGARDWGVAPLGLTAALVVASDEPAEVGRAVSVNELWWVRMNLQGQTSGTPTRLEAESGPSLGYVADYAILVAVLVLSVLMMLLFWRRDAERYRLELPADLALAGLVRRAAAGALDLAPALGVAILVYGIDFPELVMHRWPGQGQAEHWGDIAPGVLAIGVFLAHTLIAELIFARSFGKLLMGLTVYTVKGERPHAWQILARNALKGFDLVAWLLLLLPVLGPYRQRLGDLVARTVVTMPAEPQEE